MSHQTPHLAGDQKQLGAQLQQSSRKPFEFEAPADSSDLQHRLQRRRRANRESARRVRERRTEQCGVLEAQVIACLAICNGDRTLPDLTCQLLHCNHVHLSWPLLPMR